MKLTKILSYAKLPSAVWKCSSVSVYESVALMLIQNVLNIPTVQLVNRAYYSKESVHCAYFRFQICYVLWTWKFPNSSLHTPYISLRLTGRLLPAPPLKECKFLCAKLIIQLPGDVHHKHEYSCLEMHITNMNMFSMSPLRIHNNFTF